MAELVGGALLSGFLNVLFDRMATQEFIDFFRGDKVIAKLLDELKIRLLSANKLLNDAEEKQLRDQDVKKWVEELKDVVYEADHVIDKIDTESLRRKLENSESVSKETKCLNCIPILFRTQIFDKNVKGEIQEVLGKLKLLLDQTDVLGLREGIQTRPSQRLVAPLVEESGVYGREADKENIIKLLLSDNINGEKITLIPIVGMGGLGKTTLAQLVYSDRRVQDYFAPTVWVTVSEEFDVFKLTRIIYKKFTSKECEIEDLYELQSALKEKLIGKKFLFVHDDVWNENYELWDALKSPFEYGAHGSKIIVTTRSEVVASKMGNVSTYNLSTVPEDACRQLFSNHVFTNVNSGVRSNLENIGIEIVKKCKGLPLAVKSMAGLLRSVSNPEEWRRILESDVWELQFQENQKNDILPALWLSYHFLPPQLKRCFTYCSIFPKDYEFRESEHKAIIWLWMAEGLLQEEKGKRMEDVGEEYLNALIARSFFQRSSKHRRSINYVESYLVMHDLVHDLALHMSGEISFVSDGCNYLDNVRNKTRHLSYKKHINEKTLQEGLSEITHLHTLLALPLSNRLGNVAMLTEAGLLELLLGDGGRLKVLSLSESNMTKLPNSIGDLKHLRYLDLSCTKVEELPNSVCKLYNLQTMLLENCRKLTQLPTKMCCLINLRHLVIKGTRLKEMPPQMCRLRNLQTLSDFVLGENSGSRIKELGELQSLHGSLCISGLENVADIADVLQADLKSKEHLTELTLRWKGNYEDADSTKEKEVLAALEPHKKLKKLTIDNYKSETFPDWVAHESFGDMVEVLMLNCNSVCLLPPLGQLPSLRELTIKLMVMLESIDELCGTSLANPFPSLEILHISYTFSLKKWSFTRAEQEGQIFPRLKEIHMLYCGKLNVGLPASCFPSLEKIDISSSHEMVSVLPTSQVKIDSACPSLESIKLWDCPRVESFSGMGLPSNLKQLHIMHCPMLIANRMNWDLQRLSSLQSLDINAYEFEGEVDSFPEEGLLPSTLTSFSIRRFRSLKALNGKSFQHLISLQKLRIYECNELRCLPEEGLPLSLTHLEIKRCPLLKERCQRGTGEDWPKIQHIPNILIDYKEI